METNDLAPDFTLLDHTGTAFTLSTALTAGPVVLFFYPAAMTKGCTKESCLFRDLGHEFAALGAQRVGISMDTADKQAAFAQANALDYPLLVDTDGRVAALYGVKRPFDFLKVRRTTFVISTDGRVADVIASELSMEAHTDRALSTLSALTR
jgi:peroxiredoxin Q/BCP